METQTPANVANATDPSVLTTQQLWREIGHLKELIFDRINGIDKEISLTHEDMVRFPEDVQKSVDNLHTLHEEKFRSLNEEFKRRFEDISSLINEKFSGVEKQFQERDVRVEQTARDTKVGVDAALLAVGKQNEYFALSIAKSEAATMKQIDQQAALIGSSTNALDGKIQDVKERLTRIEGMSTGRKDFWGYIIGAVGLLAAISTLLAMVFRNSH